VKTPVKIALFTLVATQLMNLAFIGPLRHTGLALAIGLGACINAALLYFHLRKAGVYRPRPGWFVFLFKLALAVATMAAVLVWASGASAQWLQYPVLHKLSYLSALVVLGAGVYFGVLLLLCILPRDFMRRA